MKSRLFNIRLSFEITENKSEGFFLLKNDLISLLDAIQRTGSIKAAAEELGYSFRHIWNELNKWEEELGQSLVNRSRGKNAELSPLAEQLLWTNKEVEAKYKEQIIELQSGISYSFRKAFNSAWDPIVIEGCADSALNLLRRTTDCEIELNFTISRKGLEALREGKCELAGFNLPKSSTACFLKFIIKYEEALSNIALPCIIRFGAAKSVGCCVITIVPVLYLRARLCICDKNSAPNSL